jgi:hypothetical protein
LSADGTAQITSAIVFVLAQHSFVISSLRQGATTTDWLFWPGGSPVSLNAKISIANGRERQATLCNKLSFTTSHWLLSCHELFSKHLANIGTCKIRPDVRLSEDGSVQLSDCKRAIFGLL